MEGIHVILKPLSNEDFFIVTQWNHDPKVTEFFSPRKAIDLELQQQWFKKQLEATDKEKYIIICKKKLAKIGLISLMKIDKLNHNCEIGITIGNTDYWGKQHGKEAMQLLLKYCFEKLNMHVVNLTVFETNIRGVKFFTKLGFKHDGKMRDAIFKNNLYHSLAIMSISKAELIS
jgi:UDP-4-amino-4,6-dideoxy-N-acetyl-beta-L-altrosamine N-acetyltransferase